MSAVLVDSSILLDIFTNDRTWFARSSAAVETASKSGRLVIDAVIFAEVSVRFASLDELDALLPRQTFVREPIPFQAAFLAGKAHAKYRRQGGLKIRPLPDFFIAAHAVVAGYPLLTRDVRRHRGLFPGLRLIAPR